MYGRNWYLYCSNRPTNLVDATGCDEVSDAAAYGFGFLLHKIGFVIFWGGALLIVKGATSLMVFSVLIAVGIAAAAPWAPLPVQTCIAGAALVGLGLLCIWIGNLYMALGDDADEWFKFGLDLKIKAEKELGKRLGKV